MSSVDFSYMLDYLPGSPEIKNEINMKLFLQRLKEVSQLDWLTNGGFTGRWKFKYNLLFSLVVTRFGFCFSFNLAPAESLLHLER